MEVIKVNARTVTFAKVIDAENDVVAYVNVPVVECNGIAVMCRYWDEDWHRFCYCVIAENMVLKRYCEAPRMNRPDVNYEKAKAFMNALIV